LRTKIPMVTKETNIGVHWIFADERPNRNRMIDDDCYISKIILAGD
jgi:hypothetical protein